MLSVERDPASLMGDVIKFGQRPPKDLTLCRNGHHKWQVVKADPFAVRRGELITRYRCSRCGKERTRAQ